LDRKKIILCYSETSKGGIRRINQYLKNYLQETEIPGFIISYKPGFIKLFQKAAIAAKIFFAGLTHDAIIFTHMHLAGVMKWMPFKIPYMILTHGLEIDLDTRKLYKNILENAQRVLANSKATEQKLISTYKLQNIKQSYYPSGLKNINTGHEMIQKFRQPTVLIVGHMRSGERYKGHDELLEIWPDVLKNVPEAKLLIVGEGDDKERLLHKCNKKELQKAVKFTGEVNDEKLAEFYCKAWLFCMPSIGEGQGLVYSEALQFGLPVIACENTPAGELVDNGKTGILVEQDNVVQLKKAIILLLNEDKKRETMSVNAANTTDNYSHKLRFDKTVKQFIQQL